MGREGERKERGRWLRVRRNEQGKHGRIFVPSHANLRLEMLRGIAMYHLRKRVRVSGNKLYYLSALL